MVTRGVAGIGGAPRWANAAAGAAVVLALATPSAARAADAEAAPAPTPTAPTPADAPAPAAPTPAAAPTPVAATPAAPAPAAHDEALRWGATLGIVSVPRLLSLDVFARVGRAWSVGVMVDYLPPGIAKFGEETTLSLLQLGVQGRYFPFASTEGWFARSVYAGLAFGYQYSRADSRKFDSEVDYLSESAYFAPKLGLLFTLKSGLTMGGELGVTLPFAWGYSIASDGTEDSNARKAARTFGEFPIPTLTLFRIGYTF